MGQEDTVDNIVVAEDVRFGDKNKDDIKVSFCVWPSLGWSSHKLKEDIMAKAVMRTIQEC